MKSLLIASLAFSLAACGGSDGPRSIDGDWIYYAANGAGIGITFKPDDTYVAQVLVVTNTVTDSAGNVTSGAADDQIENGRFSLNGDTVTFTPVQYSCVESDPPYSGTYGFNGQNLTLAFSGEFASFQPNSSRTSASFVVTTGCFDSSGAFTAHPLAAIVN